MKTKTSFQIAIFIFLLNVFCLCLGAIPAFAQISDGGFGISPMKKEIIIPAGTEMTFPLSANYFPGLDPEGKYEPLRMVARLTDWTVNPNESIKVAEANTLPRSAASWVIYSPAEFVVQPNTTQVLRFTVNVPKDTPPGDYSFAVYVQDRNPPPPPKPGQRQLHIGFRFFSLIYVMVPDLKREGLLGGLEVKMKEGMPFISPKISNNGNTHLRPSHSYEVRDEAGKLVSEMKMQEWRDILRETTMQPDIPIPEALPSGKFTVTYKVDFNIPKTPIMAGKYVFEVTSDDVAARVKKLPAEISTDSSANNTEVSKKPAASTEAERKATDSNANVLTDKSSTIKTSLNTPKP